MPDFGYALGDQPALDEVARTDLLLDALAERRPVDFDDPDGEALATLLQNWRDDLRWPPASALVSPEEAVEALRTGIAARRRSRRVLAAIGSVAATLLALSGFGAVVAEARPGDRLYGLHAMFFDEPRVNEDQIMLSAKADLAKVQQMIDQGQWDQAQNQLAEVSSTVQSMNDGASRHDLMDQVNLLNTKVESRNPNATLPVPAASTTAPVAPTPSTTPPTAAGTTSPPPSPSPSPSGGRHRRHNQTPTPSSGVPTTTP
ncbi:MAG TPA: anti-sigma-D factor RsdA [Mycobacterium sp.]|nr:anti-sigma-D factor RsdA [Mycobacterium sp.]HUH71265.1 anti-sigma-D factor RsdA [Mycobacterium sp.]